MNKYELALVLNGRLEEDAKAAALEKVQGYITRFNGTVTGIEDLGNPEAEGRFPLFHQVRV